MAKSPDQALQALRLTAEEVRAQNPSWSDEMIRDYIARGEDVQMVAEAVSQIIFPMIVAGLQRQSTQFPQASSGERQSLTQLVQQISNQQSIQIVQSIQQAGQIAKASIDGYARLQLASFNPTIAAGGEQQVTGMSANSSGIQATGSRVTIINSGFVSVTIYIEVDTDLNEYADIVVRKNGSSYQTLNFYPVGGVGTTSERQPVCLTFQDQANKNDYYELYLENPSGSSVEFDVRNIIFSVGY